MAMKEPIIFATKNDQNKWQISKEARQVLESIDKTVVVNAIVGTYPLQSLTTHTTDVSQSKKHRHFTIV